MIETKIETITPEMAMEYLSTSKGNRCISKSKVQQYKNDIILHKWELNGESIIFNENGNLIDGHHRLNAVALSGQSIVSVVVRGVNKSCFSTIDSGKSRSLRNVFEIKGIVNSSKVSTVVSHVYELKLLGFIYCGSGRYTKEQKPTATKIYDEYMKDSEGYAYSTSFGMKTYNTATKSFSFHWIASLHYYLINEMGYKRDEVEFFLTWSTSKYKPCEVQQIELLRRKIIDDTSSNKKLTRDVMFALVVKAFNAFVIKKELKRLSFDCSKEVYPRFINVKFNK